jgi:transaldolase
MDGPRRLRELGQSLWLDNITRDLLAAGTLARYIEEWAVTGLTSNPTIFDLAISRTADYDEAISELAAAGLAGETLLFELAIQDLTKAADLFKPVHRRTAGVDGWVSLEASPTLAYDAQNTVAEAVSLHRRADRPNLFIKIPGTVEGAAAIEEAIFLGVPVNVTLLFSREQYVAAAEAYMRGLERRAAAGLDPDVRSVASVFVSRWDKATAGRVPDHLQNRLGIAVAGLTYVAYRDLMESDRWQRLANLGARPQRLLFGSTGTKDPAASDVLYVEALAAPHTVDTMPEDTLRAFADHGTVEAALPRDGGGSEDALAEFSRAGIDLEKLAADLQAEGAKAFVASWEHLLETIAAKSAGVDPERQAGV